VKHNISFLTNYHQRGVGFLFNPSLSNVASGPGKILMDNYQDIKGDLQTLLYHNYQKSKFREVPAKKI
jgi:hypothetical protein